MSGDSALGKLKLGVSPNPAARTSATLGIAVIAFVFQLYQGNPKSIKR